MIKAFLKIYGGTLGFLSALMTISVVNELTKKPENKPEENKIEIKFTK